MLSKLPEPASRNFVRVRPSALIRYEVCVAIARRKSAKRGSGRVSTASVKSRSTQHAYTYVLRGLADKVLLASAPEDGPGALRAKVADFGMAREMQMQSKHQTRTYGTITHMAPGARPCRRWLLMSGVLFASVSGRRQT